MVINGQEGTAERRCDFSLLKTRVLRAMQVKTAYAVEQLIWRISGTLLQRVHRRNGERYDKATTLYERMDGGACSGPGGPDGGSGLWAKHQVPPGAGGSYGCHT